MIEQNNKLDPDDFVYKCPITRMMPEDPIVASDGRTYEKAPFNHWTETTGKNTSPITREELFGAPYENRALKETNEMIVKLVERCNNTNSSTALIPQPPTLSEKEVENNRVLEARRLEGSHTTNLVRHRAVAAPVQQSFMSRIWEGFSSGFTGGTLLGAGTGVVLGAGVLTGSIEAVGIGTSLALSAFTALGVEAAAVGTAAAVIGTGGLALIAIAAIGAVGGITYGVYRALST